MQETAGRVRKAGFLWKMWKSRLITSHGKNLWITADFLRAIRRRKSGKGTGDRRETEAARRAIMVASKRLGGGQRAISRKGGLRAAFLFCAKGRKAHQMETRIFKLADINPASYNPRKDLKPGDEQYEAIKQSIDSYGFVEPLVVNIHDGKNILVGGHQRYKILTAGGAAETEAVIVDLNEAEEKTLNLALNKIDGEWDNVKLKDLLKELPKEDVLGIGFSEDEYKDLLRDLDGEMYDGDSEAAGTSVSASDDEQDNLYAQDENDAQNGADKPFEIYLSFPTEEAAQAWLKAHGIEREFTETRNIVIDLTGGEETEAQAE